MKNSMEKLIVTRKVDINSLNDNSLSDIIDYLQDLQKQYGEDVILYEDWWGHEDFSYAIQYNELESDEEYNERIQKELDQEIKLQQTKEKEKKKEELDNQILELQRERIKLNKE